MHLIINSQKEIIRKEERVEKILNDNLNILNNYLIYCKDNQNSDRTLEVIDLYLRIFILFIERQNRKITDIDSILIKNYVVELEKQKSQFNKQRDLWLLRTFLRYLNLFNYLDTDYSYLIPTMKRIPKSMPTIWSENELNQFLNTAKELSTKSDTNNRDYVMYLIAIRLGLRLSDIRNLKFDDIDWIKKEINIVQVKTKVSLKLPLLDDVGWALIDYIKKSRPISGSRFIFLNHNDLLLPVKHTNLTIKEICEIGNIDISNKRKKGIHSFRFSLATQMLNKQIPLDIISSSLGHSTINSTNHYLNLDSNNLIKCCMEAFIYEI